MKLRLSTTVLMTTLTLSATAPAAFSADWPQFLGPNRNSTSPEKGLLRSWPGSGPEVLWTADLGEGFGGPVVKDGIVYLLDKDTKGAKEIMRSFSLQTGKEVWRYAYDCPGRLPYPGSRSVPVADERHVYSCGQNGDLYAFDIKTGKPVWNKNVWKDFGGNKLPVWGISQNPLIYGDMLIISSQAPQAGVVAYNKLTGGVIWKTPNLGNETYASPNVLKIHGEDHIVMVISSTNTYKYPDADKTLGNVVGLDPRTGKVLWKYDKWECVISIPPAIDAGNNKILIVGGYDRGATMIQVNKKADGSFEASELFTTLEFGDQTKPPVLHNGYFYAMYRTNSLQEGLVCMDMNGKIMWKTKRNPDFDRGSMILADGLLLATDGLKTLYLIEPSPSAFKPISKAALLGERGKGSEQNWAPIALSDGRLLIRDQDVLLCVKVAK